jgi:outer membrane beta-barrel protein
MRNLPLCISALLTLVPALAMGSQDPLESTQGAVAADDEESSDDDLGDILGQPTESTVKEERDAVKTGDIDDTVGVNRSKLKMDRRKRVIKTIQKKDFLKLGRFEVTPNVAFVTNDPFLNRYIIGSGFGYHVTEIFAVEANLGFSPDLGEADWKPLTKQLVENNKVSPDLSPLSYFGNATFSFSPIYGKVAVSGKRIVHFDIFGAFGMGVVRTAENLVNLQNQEDPQAQATQYQIHPTTNFGGGARVVFGESLAVRLEGRSLVYIETVNSTTLEMKNNFILQGGVSFFFPGMN